MYGDDRTACLVLNGRARLGHASPGVRGPVLRGWELSMSQLLAHRAAVRVAQLAVVAAGIFFLLLLFSRQAHAATGDDPPPSPSAVTSAVSALTGPASSAAPAGSVTSAVGSV